MIVAGRGLAIVPFLYGGGVQEYRRLNDTAARAIVGACIVAAGVLGMLIFSVRG